MWKADKTVIQLQRVFRIKSICCHQAHSCFHHWSITDYWKPDHAETKHAMYTAKSRARWCPIITTYVAYSGRRKTYLCLSSWWGFTTASDQQRLKCFLCYQVHDSCVCDRFLSRYVVPVGEICTLLTNPHNWNSTPCPEKNGSPKHVQITLWIASDSHYLSFCHEKPSICNVCVKFHDNQSVHCWDIAFYKKMVENCRRQHCQLTRSRNAYLRPPISTPAHCASAFT